jgi:hypothetical protein
MAANASFASPSIDAPSDTGADGDAVALRDFVAERETLRLGQGGPERAIAEQHALRIQV